MQARELNSHERKRCEQLSNSLFLLKVHNIHFIAPLYNSNPQSYGSFSLEYNFDILAVGERIYLRYRVEVDKNRSTPILLGPFRESFIRDIVVPWKLFQKEMREREEASRFILRLSNKSQNFFKLCIRLQQIKKEKIETITSQDFVLAAKLRDEEKSCLLEFYNSCAIGSFHHYVLNVVYDVDLCSAPSRGISGGHHG